MAPTRTTRSGERQRQQPRVKAPEKQSRFVLTLCYVGIPLAICAFLLGCCGMAVLLDEPERAKWYSQTQFADVWRRLTEQNPFYTPLCVNAGMIVTLVLSSKLWEHRKALRAEAAATQAAKDK